MNSETIPAESLLASRMHVMTLAVIGQLNATANWHRMMSEWIYRSLPATPWGVAEARFSERRAPRRAPRRDESALARAHDQFELGAP
jgi:hypothetical protein